VAPSEAGRLAISQLRRDGSAGEPVNVEVKGASAATVQLAPETVAVRIGEVSGGPLGASLVHWVTDPRGSLISVTSVDLAVPATPPTTAVQDHTLGLRSGR
jgi:hypothetical protein